MIKRKNTLKLSPLSGKRRMIKAVESLVSGKELMKKESLNTYKVAKEKLYLPATWGRKKNRKTLDERAQRHRNIIFHRDEEKKEG